MNSIIENPFQLTIKPRILAYCAEHLLGLQTLAAHYENRPQQLTPEAFLDYAINALGVTINISNAHLLKTIPESGAFIAVANHPLGGLEGIAIAQHLCTVRPDLKVITNVLLKKIPELSDMFIGVDILSSDNVRNNLHSIREVHRHLHREGAVLIFPAGMVANYNLRTRSLSEYPWNRFVGKLVRRYKALCLPIYVGGKNSTFFYLAGYIHPRLRTLLLARQLSNKQHSKLQLALGQLVYPEDWQYLKDDIRVTAYLRACTEATRPD